MDNNHKIEQPKGQNTDNLTGQIQKILSSLTEKEKMAYGLIAAGVIFIIVGVVLW